MSGCKTYYDNFIDNARRDSAEVTFETVIDTSCLICTREDRPIYMIPCKHLFCRSCIRKWVYHNKKCPICRNETKYSEIQPLNSSETSCGEYCGNCFFPCRERYRNCDCDWCNIICGIILILLLLGLVFGLFIHPYL